MYVYIKTTDPVRQDDPFIVGFYVPGTVPAQFVEESIWQNGQLAADRVHYLNGGMPVNLIAQL